MLLRVTLLRLRVYVFQIRLKGVSVELGGSDVLYFCIYMYVCMKTGPKRWMKNDMELNVSSLLMRGEKKR